MAEFARQAALNYSTFVGWVAKSGKTAPAWTGIKFTEVQLPTNPASSAGAQLEVRLPDGTVVRGGRVADLASLVG